MTFLFSLLTLPEVDQGIRDLEEIRLIGAGDVTYQAQTVRYNSRSQILEDLRALYERRRILLGGKPRSRMKQIRIVRQSGY